MPGPPEDSLIFNLQPTIKQKTSPSAEYVIIMTFLILLPLLYGGHGLWSYFSLAFHSKKLSAEFEELSTRMQTTENRLTRLKRLPAPLKRQSDIFDSLLVSPDEFPSGSNLTQPGTGEVYLLADTSEITRSSSDDRLVLSRIDEVNSARLEKELQNIRISSFLGEILEKSARHGIVLQSLKLNQRYDLSSITLAGKTAENRKAIFSFAGALETSELTLATDINSISKGEKNSLFFSLSFEINRLHARLLRLKTRSKNK